LDGGGWTDPEIQKIIGVYTGMDPALLNDIAYTVRPKDGAVDMTSVRAQEQFFRDMNALEYDGEVDIDAIYRKDLLDRANALLDDQG
jgi:NitT/TauT family transport system substrate-binding protein